MFAGVAIDRGSAYIIVVVFGVPGRGQYVVGLFRVGGLYGGECGEVVGRKL